MREKGHIIFTEEFQLINIEGMRKISQSPLEPHSSDCCKGDLWMNAESRWKTMRNKILALPQTLFPQVVINHCDTFHISTNPLLFLSVGSGAEFSSLWARSRLVTHFCTQVEFRRGKIGTKPGRHCFNQVINLTSLVRSPVAIMSILIWSNEKGALLLCILLLSPWPSSSSVKVTKGKAEKLLQIGGNEGGMTTRCVDLVLD